MTPPDEDNYEATHWQAVRRLFHEARDLPSSKAFRIVTQASEETQQDTMPEGSVPIGGNGPG